MTPEVRYEMGLVAVKAAKAVEYCGAGTVEFLFEETPEGPRYYFLEMNTRLQVEHPVTEATCGRDLVWDQLQVAAGHPLDLTQENVQLHGHAIECRIYAEDPVRFLPSPGPVREVRWPHGGHVRVDSAVGSGSEVSSHYDPMIAKLTVWGADRAQAIARMQQALRETVVLGISTNIAFHQRVLSEPDFVSGNFSTRYINEHPDLLQPSELDPEAEAAAVAAAAWSTAQGLGQASAGAGEAGSAGVSPWRQASRWRR